MSSGSCKLPEDVSAIPFGSDAPPVLGPDEKLPTCTDQLNALVRMQAHALTQLHTNLLAREEMIKDMANELVTACKPRMLNRPEPEVLAALDDVIARRFRQVPASEMSPGNGGRMH